MTTETTEPLLIVLHRLEPGCLGPDGALHIEQFCELAQKALRSHAADICQWQLQPRFDKSLPEMSYFLGSKQLSKEQTDRYLEMFSEEIDAFEERFHGKLTQLINMYLARKR
ncbi:hypothetical protein KJI95_13220 [Shewanella sp. JM162201]|uniref:Orphan protein n=1 Tax=Shewanella jiangmenensis TaxID=2837387 RepID=A0ABS5V686_9GAMM|nr:hypothetical protein [Shewanella jiangmenensis]MBT1445478.1 hypothetical protein [Shewanella jiangmenensis]